jgi:hypothetical protein
LIQFLKFRYRDVFIYGKGYAKEWNSHMVFEIKWDANRDPDQKFLVTFKTNTSDIYDGEQFLGQLIIEYPDRIVNVDLELKYIGIVVECICLTARFMLLFC